MTTIPYGRATCQGTITLYEGCVIPVGGRAGFSSGEINADPHATPLEGRLMGYFRPLSLVALGVARRIR